jgi:glycosyltransferase involved in cell wall biosynthesis
MRQALIFSPSLDGHRQVYCRVWTGMLLEMGLKVRIAGRLTHDGRGLPIPYLESFRNHPEVVLMDTGHMEGGGKEMTNEAFLDLQRRSAADVTIIAEADDHLGLIAGQVGRRERKFRGRTIGVFLRSMNYIYESPSLRERWRRWKHFPARWRVDPKLMHEVLIPRAHVLDAVLTLDENFVARHRGSHGWLPDIYKPLDDPFQEKGRLECALWTERLERFRGENRGRFMFLYFGTAYRRRGYDTLLRLALDEDGSFVHCGLNNGDLAGDPNVETMRATLRSRGSYLETGAYIEDQSTVELFFREADKVILPYDNFLGSSGVMLQALDCGRPVLVARQGLMSFRVGKHGLGATSVAGDYRALRETFRGLRAIPASQFQDDISRFMRSYRKDRVRAALEYAVAGKGIPPPLPGEGVETGQRDDRENR